MTEDRGYGKIGTGFCGQEEKKMRLEQIDQVIELAETGSFSKAARNLYMSQPNLSKSIRILEDEVGGKLFTRTQQGLILTSVGKEFLTYAKTVQHSVRRMQQLGDRPEGSFRKKFSVVAGWQKWVGELFSSMVLQYEDQSIRFFLHHADGQEAQMDMVETNQAELGLITVLEREKRTVMRQLRAKNLEYHPIQSGQVSIAFGRENSLYGKDIKEVTPEMLRDFTLVFANQSQQNDFFDMMGEKVFKKNQLKSIINIGEPETLYLVVSKTKAVTWAAYAERFYKKTLWYDGVYTLPLAGEKNRFEVGWIKRQSSPLSDIAQEFLDEIEKTAGDEAEKCPGK